MKERLKTAGVEVEDSGEEVKTTLTTTRLTKIIQIREHLKIAGAVEVVAEDSGEEVRTSKTTARKIIMLIAGALTTAEAVAEDRARAVGVITLAISKKVNMM